VGRENERGEMKTSGDPVSFSSLLHRATAALTATLFMSIADGPLFARALASA
jgi:hypothetical protein